jgi:quercetin dioxygenase-like cupin family protein
MLKPGQKIAEHKVPDSPFYVVVVKGRGMFSGHDGQQYEYGPGSLLILDPGELHTVSTLDEELVFISFMQAVDNMRPNRAGGEIGRV